MHPREPLVPPPYLPVLTGRGHQEPVQSRSVQPWAGLAGLTGLGQVADLVAPRPGPLPHTCTPCCKPACEVLQGSLSPHPKSPPPRTPAGTPRLWPVPHGSRLAPSAALAPVPCRGRSGVTRAALGSRTRRTRPSHNCPNTPGRRRPSRAARTLGSARRQSPCLRSASLSRPHACPWAVDPQAAGPEQDAPESRRPAAQAAQPRVSPPPRTASRFPSYRFFRKTEVVMETPPASALSFKGPMTVV